MTRHSLLAAAAFATLLQSQYLSAAEQPYLDDRSSPEALIRSLYNAINRNEYARAYSYFADPPAETLEGYAEGYADTERVELVTGPASTEGAAGSVHYSVPVAIRAWHTDGQSAVFSGCYDLRLANPQAQTSPFTPLHIVEGQLAPAKGALEQALPARCGAAPPPEPGEVAMEKAKALFEQLYGDTCRAGEAGAEEQPESHLIRFNYVYEPEDAPKTEVRLFRFFCDRGAYNEVHVYLMEEAGGQILPLRFATPELDIRYENDDPEAAVEEIRIIGYQARDLLVNSSFDPETLELQSHIKWRGLGDASENGLWIFRDGAFTLVKYEVDASYDGEINPELMLDYHTGP